jgi:hypothetical protein
MSIACSNTLDDRPQQRRLCYSLHGLRRPKDFGLAWSRLSPMDGPRCYYLGPCTDLLLGWTEHFGAKGGEMPPLSVRCSAPLFRGQIALGSKLLIVGWVINSPARARKFAVFTSPFAGTLRAMAVSASASKPHSPYHRPWSQRA